MLYQNFKGFLTLALVLSLVATGFYFYKGVVEDGFIQRQGVEQFAITTENVEVEPKIEITSNSVTVEWETPFEVAGTVKYCPNKNEGDTCKVTSTSFGKTHSIQILDLEPGQSYFYQIGIDGTYYPESDFYTFKTSGTGAVGVNKNETPKSSIDQDFLDAIKTQNLKYDYNKDGKVTIADMRFAK